MLGPFLIAILLASGPAPGLEADAASLRRELDAVAGRIEVLKARRLAGESVEGELWPLLVRSQELASELERLRPEASEAPPAAAADDSEQKRVDDLRERAGMLREEADRLLRARAALDTRILAALRSATAPEPATEPGTQPAQPAWSARPTQASAGAAPSAPRRRSLAAAIGPLVEQRIQLDLRVHALEAQADQLEAQARTLERGNEPRSSSPPPAPPAPTR
jgi:hypothetical protein